MINTFSNNSTKSTVSSMSTTSSLSSSGLPSSSSTASSSPYQSDMLASPVSILRNGHRAISSASSSNSSIANSNVNNNDTIVEANCIEPERARDESAQQIRSLFSNVSDLKSSSTWSTFFTSESNLLASPKPIERADYETIMRPDNESDEVLPISSRRAKSSLGT